MLPVRFVDRLFWIMFYFEPDHLIYVVVGGYLEDTQTFSVLIMQVADSLLHDESSNLETLMFCSQTLRSKVRHTYIYALCHFLQTI